MLLEGAVAAAVALREAYRSNAFEDIADEGSRCRAILIALMTELDASKDRLLAEQLSSIHAWLWQQVASARCADDLDDPITTLEQQRDAWREAVDLLRAAPDEAASATGALDVAG